MNGRGLGVWIVLVLCRSGYGQIDCAAPPPCARVYDDSLLFTALAIDSGPTDARLQVQEVFAGLPAGTKEVMFGGPWIEKGHTYLIDANREDDGRFGLRTCGSTGETPSNWYTDGMLDYLRQRAAGKAKTSLTVLVVDRNVGVPDAEVTISGLKGRKTARTNAKGIANFGEVAPGRYQVTGMKEHYSQDPEQESSREINVLAGACASGGIALRAVASVSGVVLDAKGSSVPDLKLDLMQTSDGPWMVRPPLQTVTDAAGAFHFNGVSPGRYYLGTNLFEYTRDSPIPRTYFPGRREKGDAAPIEVAPGDSINGLAMVLPDFGEPRKVQICVVDSSGLPVSGAGVSDSYTKIGGEFARLAEKLITDDSGCVQAKGLTGAAYALRASFTPKGPVYSDVRELLRQVRSSDETVISPGKDAVHAVLVLKDPRSPAKQ